MLCSRIQNLLSAYCDRELTGVEMLEIQRHLHHCSACHQEYTGLVRMKTLLGALGPVEPPSPFDPDGLARPRPAYGFAASSSRLGQLTLVHLRSLLSPPRPSLPSLLFSSARLAAGGILAVTLLALALLRPAQHADAVSAQVPGVLPAEEAAPTFTVSNQLPYYAVPSTTRPLPGDSRFHGARDLPFLVPVTYTAPGGFWGQR